MRLPSENYWSCSSQSHVSKGDEKIQCPLSPLRDVFFSRHHHNYVHHDTFYLHLLPILGNHVGEVLLSLRDYQQEQLGNHSLYLRVPWLSKHKQFCQQDETGSSTNPDAVDDEMSFF